MDLQSNLLSKLFNNTSVIQFNTDGEFRSKKLIIPLGMGADGSNPTLNDFLNFAAAFRDLIC